MASPNNRQLSIFLLKPDMSVDSAVKNISLLDEKPVNDGHNFIGRLFVKKPNNKRPKWANFLQEGLSSPIHIENVSNSALLFIVQGNRLFVITFGYGRHLLANESWEENFGLKVVLNTVDQNCLRSIDLQRFQDMTLNTRMQVSQVSDLNAFGIDASQDILKAVTGEPRSKDFAKRITGADSLVIQKNISFEALGDLCQELLVFYEQETYKEYFSWIDNLRMVKQDTVKNELNQILIAALQQGNTENLYLSFPEVMDWQEIEGFRYSIQPNEEVYSDLEIETFLSFFDDLQKIDINTLKRFYIEVIGEDSQVIKKWQVFKCIVFETPLCTEKPLHILSAGIWFKAENNYAQTVRREIQNIMIVNLPLPLAFENEEEGDYNSRAARDDSYYLMDKKLVKPSGASSSIEFCDLLSTDGDIIHVKRRKGGSSVLSHLFSQGLISAELLKMDFSFREGIHEHLQGQESYKNLLPLNDLNSSCLRVVFALIGKSGKNTIATLPFFSQLNLIHAEKRIKTLLGFQVGFCSINIH
jgi:uncharacterized protein (TIGR04141 family)